MVVGECHVLHCHWRVERYEGNEWYGERDTSGSGRRLLHVGVHGRRWHRQLGRDSERELATSCRSDGHAHGRGAHCRRWKLDDTHLVVHQYNRLHSEWRVERLKAGERHRDGDARCAWRCELHPDMHGSGRQHRCQLNRERD